MTNRFMMLGVTACAVLLASNGCQRPQPPVIALTPRQRQADIDGNSHIPEAQKEAIKARIANAPPVKAQSALSGSR